jgi:putative hemolysin
MNARFAPPAAPVLSVRLARTPREIDDALRLRYRVFAGELGADLPRGDAARDEDAFDPWCEHLVVRDERADAVVGTYRVLTAERARRLGTFYAETEFDLTRLARLRGGLCEVGRACVDPAYRGGAALLLLWHGLAALARERGATHLIGCASVPLAGGAGPALALWRALAATHLAPIEHRVFARAPLVARGAETDAPLDAAPPPAPPLLRAYLRLGAWIGGEPAHDPAFRTADLFVMLPVARLGARHARPLREAA